MLKGIMMSNNLPTIINKPKIVQKGPQFDYEEVCNKLNDLITKFEIPRKLKYKNRNKRTNKSYHR